MIFKQEICTLTKNKCMAEFDLSDLEKINSQQEIIDFLVDHEIIKEKKFKKELCYQKDIKQLQQSLNALQSHVVESKKRVLIIFEGRDAAGKGGTISRMIEYMNPKKVRVISLPKPTEQENGQWYFQRYLAHLPNEGEIVIFDRSWYNRAVVEPVFGFCSEQQYNNFIPQVNQLENLLQQDGIIVLKLFLSISKEEQAERLQDRKQDPLKQWKLGPLDQQAQEKWDSYSHYINALFKKTSPTDAPWVEILTDNKKEARLASMRYILNSFTDFTSSPHLINKNLITVHK